MTRKIDLNTLIITSADVAKVIHEAQFAGYKNMLHEIQRNSGTNAEVAESIIKECKARMGEAFFAAVEKLESAASDQ
jgi:hypothetical protein